MLSMFPSQVLDPYTLVHQSHSGHRRQVLEAVAAADLAWVPVGPHVVLDLWTRSERVWLLHEQHLKKLRSGLAAFKAGLQERQGGGMQNACSPSSQPTTG